MKLKKIHLFFWTLALLGEISLGSLNWAEAVRTDPDMIKIYPTLESDPKDKETREKKSAEVLEMADPYIPIPQPERPKDGPFLMSIDHVFPIEGYGTVVTGRIERGIVKAGDDVEIVGLRPSLKTTISRVEKSQKRVDFFNLVGISGAPSGVPQIDVTFDIAANDIVQVSAKDKAMEKQQQIKIQTSGEPSEAEIKKMIKNVHENESEYKKRREIFEMKNHEESLLNTSTKSLSKRLDQGAAGDEIQVVLKGMKAEDVKRGQVLAASGSLKPHAKFKAEAYFLTKEEGGRHTPFPANYRPQFYFRTTYVTGDVQLPEGVERVMPGDKVTMKVALTSPIAMDEGLRFAIREGERTVGAGRVSKIIE